MPVCGVRVVDKWGEGCGAEGEGGGGVVRGCQGGAGGCCLVYDVFGAWCIVFGGFGV